MKKEEEAKLRGTTIAGVTLYSVREVSELMKVTPQTVRRYIKSGRLKSRKIGRNLFCSETDLRHFVNATQKPQK